ncbi:MAG: hypothetical protein FWD83_07645 [Promicromonosporaceae bacterium]|nr:hypothetical protein [Promicromonosporaceae bacterium]
MITENKSGDDEISGVGINECASVIEPQEASVKITSHRRRAIISFTLSLLGILVMAIVSFNGWHGGPDSSKWWRVIDAGAALVLTGLVISIHCIRSAKRSKVPVSNWAKAGLVLSATPIIMLIVVLLLFFIVLDRFLVP